MDPVISKERFLKVFISWYVGPLENLAFWNFPDQKIMLLGGFIPEKESLWKASDPKILIFGKDLNLEK
jgi:hypothetical protein